MANQQNPCLCNAEWQLPQRRTGFLIRINARRHSDLLRGYGINMDRESTETFQPCRGDPLYCSCIQTERITSWPKRGNNGSNKEASDEFKVCTDMN